ncbi:hypothetical protein FRB90_001477 [Tulasnella sp. 427]|nr:hypothetical protein FRB90_001477 [Tulasnella sp. 427]
MQAGRANNAAHKKIAQVSAVYYRLRLSNTKWELEVHHSDIEELRKNDMTTSVLVNVHLATLYNSYYESFPSSSPDVILLPDSTFANWRKQKGQLPNTGVNSSIKLARIRHVVFPMYWSSKSRWLLVILAGFGSLIPDPNVGATPDRKSNFQIIIFDSSVTGANSVNKATIKPLRDFTKALLYPALDLDSEGILSAPVIMPKTPSIPENVAQGAQPGHYFSLFLQDQEGLYFQSGNFEESDWRLPDQNEALRRFQRWLVTHSDLAVAHLKLKTYAVPAAPPRLPDGAPGVVKVALTRQTAHGLTPIDTPASAAQTHPHGIAVVVTKDRWKATRPNAELSFDRSSPELELDQNSEPANLLANLFALSLGDGADETGGALIDDAVEAITAEVEAELGLDVMDEGSDHVDDEAHSVNSSLLRSGYLDHIFIREVLPGRSACAGRSCRMLASVMDEDGGGSPSLGMPGLPSYRCQDCLGDRFFCEDCIVSTHNSTPLHRIEKWNGVFFEPGNPTVPQLHQLLYLGHNGSRCKAPFTSAHWARPTEGLLTVVHTNGYHKLQVCYCNCLGSPEPYQQLLQSGLFPATHSRPATAFTFNLLKHFRCFNLASKTAAYDYHKALVQLSDGVLPQAIPSSYHAFIDVIHQWRMLTMLKRSGKYTAAGLKRGELATPCPACPHPGINLPDGWEDNPNRNKAGTGKDSVAADLRRQSMLGDAAYWVLAEPFKAYLNTRKASASGAKAKAECTTLAGDQLTAASSKAGKNEITGAFAISCRHVCFCPSGVCDFAKGEGFHFVDVPMSMVIQAAIDSGLKDLVISYDIACKYSINFLDRVSNTAYPLLPANLQSLVSILWLIGKFHLSGHREECQKFFNFNYTKGVGRMSGELVETIWSYFDFLKYQTREMGPGSRQEMLSDAMSYWNWQKIVKLSDTTRVALLQANVQCELASQRLKGIEENLGPDAVAQLATKSSHAGPEQFVPSRSGTHYPSRKDVLLALQQDEEDLRIEAPRSAAVPHWSFRPGSPDQDAALARLNWLNTALTLETTQVKYVQLLEQHHKTSLPGLKTSLNDKIRKHKARLEIGLEAHYAFLRSQGLPLPIAQLTPQEPHKDPIIVPSGLSVTHRQTFNMIRLAKHEQKLRIGLAFNALERLRKALGVRSFLTRHIRKRDGYAANTRTQETFKQAEINVKQWSALYRRSWDALNRLDTDESALQGLRPLDNKDLILLSTWLEQEKYRDRGSRLPWIWSVAPVAQDGRDLVSTVQDWGEEEWVHAKAALDWWLEKNHLLREEIGRIALFFKWTTDEWAGYAS